LPTCVFGALLPLAMTMLSSDLSRSPEAVGRAYAVNTLGSILGSCLTGLYLLPVIGSGFTIQLAVFALVAFGVVYVVLTGSSLRALSITAVAALGISVVAVKHGKIDYTNIIKSAYHQSAGSELSFTDAIKYFSKTYEEFTHIFEGKTALISLSYEPQDLGGDRNYYRLKTNGLNESLYVLDNLTNLPRFEALLGYLPYAVTRAPK